MTVKKKDVKPKKVKPEFYQAKVGCWNCDITYEIPIPKGINTPAYIMNVDPICIKCGCDTLRMFAEYKNEKKVMKDVILHNRIEHMEHEQHKEQPTKHDHYK